MGESVDENVFAKGRIHSLIVVIAPDDLGSNDYAPADVRLANSPLARRRSKGLDHMLAGAAGHDDEQERLVVIQELRKIAALRLAKAVVA